MELSRIAEGNETQTSKKFVSRIIPYKRGLTHRSELANLFPKLVFGFIPVIFLSAYERENFLYTQ